MRMCINVFFFKFIGIGNTRTFFPYRLCTGVCPPLIVLSLGIIHFPLIRCVAQRSSLAQHMLRQRHRCARVVRLDVDRGDLAILDQERITLGTVATKDCAAVKGQIERSGELSGGISEETDLLGSLVSSRSREKRCIFQVLTPDSPAGSSVSPHAFILSCFFSSGLSPILGTISIVMANQPADQPSTPPVNFLAHPLSIQAAEETELTQKHH